MSFLRKLELRMRKSVESFLTDNLYHARLELEKHMAQKEHTDAMVALYRGRVDRLQGELREATSMDQQKTSPTLFSGSESTTTTTTKGKS